MKKWLFFIVILCQFNSLAQEKIEIIESARLGKSRQITIITPPSYEIEKDKKYPVIYVMDSEYMLKSFLGTLQYGYYFDDLPEVILVGIHQSMDNYRISDTYTDDEGLPAESGAKFFEFIGGELVPFIDKRYRTLEYRVVAGHDLTAGFLNFFLYKDNPLFDGYISLCPDLAFDMETRIPERLKLIKKPISYFQATSDADLTAIYESVQELDTNIKEITNLNLLYKLTIFEGLSHYSVVPNAIPQGLYHVFNGYQPITKNDFQKLKDLNGGFITFLKNKYDRIKKVFGVNLKVRLIDIVAVQMAILETKTAVEELNELAKIADKSYPKTILASFVESSYFEAKGDYSTAIQTLEKGMDLKEIAHYTKGELLNKIEKLKEVRAGQYKKNE